jgi:hypothetical protein
MKTNVEIANSLEKLNPLPFLQSPPSPPKAQFGRLGGDGGLWGKGRIISQFE